MEKVCVYNALGECVDEYEVEGVIFPERPQTIEDQITDIQETLIDHEYRLVLTEIDLYE